MMDRGSIKSQPPGYTFESHGYELFQMIFVSSGNLRFESLDAVEPIARELQPGDTLILRHGSRFRLSSPATGYGGVCYLDYGPEDPRQFGVSFAVQSGRLLVELVARMQYALAHPDTCGRDTLALLGRTIAWRALEEGLDRLEAAPVGLAEHWAARIRDVVGRTLYAGAEEFRAGIRSLGLSYRQLSRHFRETTGVSIKQYQIAERLREAKRLLAQTGLSVTAIAFELHYPSSQKFAAQFKRQTGLTPSGYRKLSSSIRMTG